MFPSPGLKRHPPTHTHTHTVAFLSQLVCSRKIRGPFSCRSPWHRQTWWCPWKHRISPYASQPSLAPPLRASTLPSMGCQIDFAACLSKLIRAWGSCPGSPADWPAGRAAEGWEIHLLFSLQNMFWGWGGSDFAQFCNFLMSPSHLSWNA